MGISLRQPQMLFEPTGTSFARYVTQRRLLQCCSALTSPTGVARSVADIAFGWDFNSLATFYRALRPRIRIAAKRGMRCVDVHWLSISRFADLFARSAMPACAERDDGGADGS